MGTPDNPAEYVRFDVDDLTVYVAQALLEKLEAGATEQPFYIDGYGRYTLVFSEPWGSGVGLRPTQTGIPPGF